MANITLNYRGLTGKRGTITAADTATFVSLITLIIADEDPTVGVLTNSDYDIALERDTSITDVANGSDPIAAGAGNLGLVNGDTIICIDDKKNLLTTNTKEVRQLRKLRIASVKRYAEGKANYTYDATSLPDTYNDNLPGADDNPNTGGLLPKRPWISVSEIATPLTPSEAVGSNAIVNLQVWYDAADTEQYVPSATDETGITQLKDKSAFAHNANPLGGATVRPSYEDTTLQNGYGYVEFDGVNDNFYINPFPQISEQNTYTIFFAAKLNDTADGQALGGVNQGGLSIRTAGGVFTTGTAGLTGTTAVSVDTDWHVFAMRIDLGQGTDAARSLLRIDGHNKSTGANDISSYSGTADATTGTNDGYFLGCRGAGGSDSAGPTAYAAMYMGEVLMFNYALTDIEVKNIENYLSNKWDI